ncbi:MAG TPA: hypothetical protein VGW12_09095 [Pyrinomonadaceae bacterium]|nr:hypothetical protein [Pyrinomonadaceae bacterium]
MQNDPIPQSVSPDGTLRVEFDVQTGRMSHEIYSPRVVSVANGEVLVDLWGTYWDASAQFKEPGTVDLQLRYYPGDKPGFGVKIDARRRTFSFEDAPGEQHPLAKFEKLAERKHKAQKSDPQSRPPEPPHQVLWMLLCALVMFAIIFGTVYLFRSMTRKRLWRGSVSYRKINFGSRARVTEAHVRGATIYPAEQRKKLVNGFIGDRDLPEPGA